VPEQSHRDASLIEGPISVKRKNRPVAPGFTDLPICRSTDSPIHGKNQTRHPTRRGSAPAPPRPIERWDMTDVCFPRVG
jgi:hypothetical protein